jgi:hypothetical protein
LLLTRFENSSFIRITPALGSNGEHSNKEYTLDELASVNIFVMEDELTSNAELFADAVSELK